MRSLKKNLVAAAAALAIIGGSGVAATAGQPLTGTDHAAAQLAALSLQWAHCQPAGPKAGAFCWSPPPSASGHANARAAGPLHPGDSPARPASSRN